MFIKVEKNIKSLPNYSEKKFLLAFSGGIDSVVLAHIFKGLNLNFSLAHCNFKLRGTESDDDQNFVENFSDDLNIPLFLKICDLSKINNNIQLEARNARYDWFKNLREQYNFDFIVTAHHLNDSLETFIINLQRGTGLKGLLGIQNKETVLRPMLNITRDEIRDFALKNNLSWREDTSNSSDKYRRNFIRHQIIPKLTEDQPAFYHNFFKTLKFLQQNQSVADDYFKLKLAELVIIEGDIQILNLEAFESFKQKEFFLFNWLQVYGFTDIDAALRLINSQSGKEIFSSTHRLTKHHQQLILQKKVIIDNNIYFVDSINEVLEKPVGLKMKVYERDEIDFNKIFSASKDEIYLDYDLINFPLSIRKWEEGDYFYPLGMSGKKKISDYLINLKISLPDKEKIWLLCNQNKIVWIIGYRPDNRYKITDKTKRILHITTY